MIAHKALCGGKSKKEGGFAVGGPRKARAWVEDRARRVGMKPVERWVSSVADWDAYEGALLRGIEAFVEESPRDPEGPKMLAEQRAFHAAQVRWGRETMGFAVHLLRKAR